jgi:acyl-coenzyme A thioesterase PaaI-like protein
VSTFKPQVANFEARVRKSFDRQPMMHTIGASLARIEPGEVESRSQCSFASNTGSCMPGS